MDYDFVRMYACVYVCIVYVCMHDVRHDTKIPCTSCLAINGCYLILSYYCRPLYYSWKRITGRIQCHQMENIR